MFCQWCGRNMQPRDGKCPICGGKQEPLLQGNGFWDLCGSPLPKNEEDKVNDEPAEQDAEKWSSSKLLVSLLTCMVVLILCINLYMILNRRQLANQLQDLNQSMEAVQTELSQLQAKMEVIDSTGSDSEAETEEVTEEDTGVDFPYGADIGEADDADDVSGDDGSDTTSNGMDPYEEEGTADSSAVGSSEASNEELETNTETQFWLEKSDGYDGETYTYEVKTTLADTSNLIYVWQQREKDADADAFENVTGENGDSLNVPTEKYYKYTYRCMVSDGSSSDPYYAYYQEDESQE